MIATTTIRVRYKDTDCMNVVYYGNYLTYFEVGRVEYLRQSGMTIAQVNKKVFMPVAEASVKYHRPARLDELLQVRYWVSERKRASFRFDYTILTEAGERVATGYTVHAVLDPATGRMVAIPPWMAAKAYRSRRELIQSIGLPPRRPRARSSKLKLGVP